MSETVDLNSFASFGDRRASGVLLHVSSLPGDCGIGQLGSEAMKFVDFLTAAKQTYWQVLPLVPTGYGDSPYQSCCVSAGNEYFIDLHILQERGLLEESDLTAVRSEMSSRVDYEKLFHTIPGVLKKAFARYNKRDKQFNAFLKKGEYADYALFRAVKAAHGHNAWIEWEDKYKFRDEKTLAAFAKDNADELRFWQWCQFEFDRQWQSLKSYANSRGVQLIGDLPIYAAYDSVECWKNPELFLLTDNRPTVVAGCPPDYFSEDGQLWGNPIYDWEKMIASGYAWWKTRLKKCFALYDCVRIDHFRGFDRYFAIPYGEKTARGGEWRQGPGAAMFVELEREFGKMPVIAEDLGILDDSAREMFRTVGYPGMKILQYAFDNPDNDYLPHNYNGGNCIVYPGTHDNDTMVGYYNALDERGQTSFFRAVCAECRQLRLPEPGQNAEEICAAVVRLSFFSRAVLSVCQFQDLASIGGEGRINVPSVLSSKNWSYRIPVEYGDGELAGKISSLTIASARYN